MVGCQLFQEPEALLYTLSNGGAGVGFIHNQAFGGRRQKGVAVRIRLDVVQADDRYREMIKERTTWRHLPFQIFTVEEVTAVARILKRRCNSSCH